MRNFIINVGKKSKKAFTKEISSEKKDKVLKDYYSLIQKNKKKIMGHHSNEIQKLLGYVAKSEVIHKDDMVEV